VDACNDAARTLRNTNTMTPPTSNAPMTPTTMNLARFKTGIADSSDMAGIPARSLAMFQAPVYSGKNDWNEKKSGDRGEQQSTDDGAAQRCVLLRSLAQTERHGNHTDDHGQSRHQYRPDAHLAGVKGRFEG